MGLFIKKPFEALLAEANASGSKSLKRVLGPWSLVALGVGVIIGAGLFSITGTVAAGYTGPAITLSFAIAALGCCFAGLCYAEFASMIPVAGGQGLRQMYIESFKKDDEISAPTDTDGSGCYGIFENEIPTDDPGYQFAHGGV